MKKIKRNIEILRRLGNTVPQHSLIALYKTLIEPYFRYCSTDSLIQKLQTLENRAVRIVTPSKYDTANHPQLLKDLEWLNVHNIIKFDTAALMYKVHNEIVPDPIIDLFDKTETMHKYSTRSVTNQNYLLKRTNLNKGERGILVAAVKVWNDLPASIKESESLELFKSKLKHYLLTDFLSFWLLESF